MKQLKLFAGGNNRKLAQEVADSLGINLAKVEIIRFDDSEVRIRIVEEVGEKPCIIIQSTSNPTDQSYMELFFMADALTRSKAQKIIGVIPYLGYARQNIQHRSGEDVSINVIIKFLETVGFSQIFTFDLHDEATAGLFSIPFKHLSTFPLLAKKVRSYLKDSLSETIVVSPDQGGVERARGFAAAFFQKPEIEIGIIEKKRDLEHAHRSQAMELFGEVKGKTVILVDDIITSGGTLLNAAALCLEKGAKRILAAITHHDFSQKAPKKIQDSPIEKFFTTNTIELKESQKFPKLEEISSAPILAEELKKL